MILLPASRPLDTPLDSMTNCDEHKNREPEDLQVRIDIDADENIRDLLGRFARK